MEETMVSCRKYKRSNPTKNIDEFQDSLATRRNTGFGDARSIGRDCQRKCLQRAEANCQCGFHAGIHEVDHMTNVYGPVLLYLIFRGEQVVCGTCVLVCFGGVDGFGRQNSCRM